MASAAYWLSAGRAPRGRVDWNHLVSLTVFAGISVTALGDVFTRLSDENLQLHTGKRQVSIVYGTLHMSYTILGSGVCLPHRVGRRNVNSTKPTISSS